MDIESTLRRRQFLATLSIGCLSGISGCGKVQDDSQSKPAGQADDKGTHSTTPDVDDVAPSITSFSVKPIENGTKLAVELIGEDDQLLVFAEVAYGDNKVQRELQSDTVHLNVVLDEITKANADTPGHVSYLLRDSEGNEVEKSTTVDQQPPTLSVATAVAKNAGELQLNLRGEDDVGLHQFRVKLPEGESIPLDVTGQQQATIERTISATDHDGIQSGHTNTIEASITDTLGNETRKKTEQYVRKYDKMDDTRVSVGTVYQPYFGFKNKVAEKCRDERIPTVGRYERPLPYDVFNRHIDQMTGHGIDRVMIEFLGNETGKHDKRFLESELIDEVQIEPFYTAAQNLWKEGYWSTAESYRDDLVKPHMTFMREHILSRDNVTKIDGRPVIQMWNSVTWALDYQYNRIVDEWGGYDAFFDEIRSLLSVDGNEPFFVGGTNWWGHGGYPDGRKAELTKHFDATTTWLVGAELHDGFTSQETALNWVEENWQGHREFTDKHDMDFVPMVFPGFNERTPDEGNCDPRDTGEGRLVPRSPDFFAKMLNLADEYRTTKLINNSVYNHWQEGTHIEPGVFEPGPFGKEDYGTAYLDVVKQFQQQ